MAIWVHMLAIVGVLFGSQASARHIGEAVSRNLQQQPQSALCGSQGYIIGQSYCVSIGTKKWICPVDQPCACPTTTTGLNPFNCYDPATYSCSNNSPNWPKSGIITGAGQSNEGACPVLSSGAPGLAPAPAPGPGLSMASAPISEPAPSEPAPSM